MKSVASKITYLEMHGPPETTLDPPPQDAQVRRLTRPSLDDYRTLYRGVGGPYHWTDRLRMPDDQLRGILEDDAVEVYLLEVDGRPAGYSELDRRIDGQVELAYFGLFPEFVGRGLGKFLLAWTLRQAWSYRPERVWVHTCDLDHPAALPVYLRAGFRVYDEKTVQQVILDE